MNAALEREFSKRTIKPRVLVVTHGATPEDDVVERAFGWQEVDGDSRQWLTINRRGADGVESSADWRNFVSP